MTVRKCDACGAPIVFIKTPGGRWMPCEKYPVPYQVNEGGSNPDTLVDKTGRTVRGQITHGGIGYKMAYMPHWQYCPGANRARKASRAAKAAAEKRKKETPPAPTWEQTSLL